MIITHTKEASPMSQALPHWIFPLSSYFDEANLNNVKFR